MSHETQQAEAEEKELSTITLTHEEWAQCTITIPEYTEVEVFGRQGKTEVRYPFFVNDKFYHAFRYHDFSELHAFVKKQHLDLNKKLPKFPKQRLSIKSPRTTEIRRIALEAWMQKLVTFPTLVESDAFAKFASHDPDYEAIAEELLEKAKSLDSLEEDKWKLRCEKKGVKLWTLGEKLDGSKFLVVRTYTKIACPKDFVLKIYNTKAEWANWQKEMEACDTIEAVLGTEDVIPSKELIYSRYKAPTGVSNRDVALFCWRFHGTPTDKDDSTVTTVLNESIAHRKVPRVKGCVRGFMNISKTTFRAVDDGKATELTSILHMDPRGMLPAWLVNTLATNATDSIVKMRTYMETTCSK